MLNVAVAGAARSELVQSCILGCTKIFFVRHNKGEGSLSRTVFFPMFLNARSRVGAAIFVWPRRIRMLPQSRSECYSALGDSFLLSLKGAGMRAQKTMGTESLDREEPIDHGAMDGVIEGELHDARKFVGNLLLRLK